MVDFIVKCEDNEYYIMAEEPFPDVTTAEIKAYFSDKHTEKDLANALAITWNKFCWFEDNIDDHKEGTPEHKLACTITEEWRALMWEYKNRIFEILASKNIIIPQKGQRNALKPFMKKYGFVDASGWWIRND